MHKLEITCNKDLTTIKEINGEASYLYYFLLTTRKLSVDVVHFINQISEATGVNWHSKELCEDSFFIITGRVLSTHAHFIFDVETDFVPKQNQFIKEII